MKPLVLLIRPFMSCMNYFVMALNEKGFDTIETEPQFAEDTARNLSHRQPDLIIINLGHPLGNLTHQDLIDGIHPVVWVWNKVMEIIPNQPKVILVSALNYRARDFGITDPDSRIIGLIDEGIFDFANRVEKLLAAS